MKGKKRSDEEDEDENLGQELQPLRTHFFFLTRYLGRDTRLISYSRNIAKAKLKIHDSEIIANTPA